MAAPTQGPEAVLFSSATRRVYYPTTGTRVSSLGSENSSGGETETAQATSSISTGNELTPEEQRALQELRARDREVRAHEQAHIAAGGAYVQGGASYTYQRGPDGQNYAIGGEVSIDTGAVPGDPRATLRKAEAVRRAATAPADPSSQDRAVAAQATAMAIQARVEIARQNAAEVQENDSGTENNERNSLFQRPESVTPSAADTPRQAAQLQTLQSNLPTSVTGAGSAQSSLNLYA